MLNTYRNIGPKLSRSIVHKVLRGGNTVTRISTTNKLLMDNVSSLEGQRKELFNNQFNRYIMCGISKLGDGSVCGP